MNILFLGDSITDCAHNFTPDNLGGGYVKLIASRHPEITAVNGGTKDCRRSRQTSFYLIQKKQPKRLSQDFSKTIRQKYC